ncbi:insulin-like growth factor-binding protein complex acid labile subunit isoform X1 [Branchiostoma lanceolatum]|uniref:insulin-like growth factor-binding protein complex acid labile subunit isoform X1 n=1 Tax=Branchiostoma lanceolatum TaxID=7740 RepID=UPI0034533114
MVHTRASCLSALLLTLLMSMAGVVIALDCAPQCRCHGATVDCSHGALTAYPRDQLIPSSTEIFLLNDNQISGLNRNPLLPNLLELNLEDNSITSISRPGSPFSRRPNLQVLRLGGNVISTVPTSAFDGLRQLVRLYLNRNTITTITAFGSNSFLDSLEMLDLQDNRLTSIGIETFTGVPLLIELNLSSNSISRIEDGSFGRLKKLRVLYLHSNHIGVLTSATFRGMPALTRLTLSDNKIQTLPGMAFIGATNLGFLDLSSNDLSTVTRTAFSGLYNLTTLLLERNNISSIEDGAFGDQVKLQSLVLRYNILQNMSASTLTSTDLWELDLADNRLTAVRREDFARLTKLKYLRLHTNRIRTVEDGSFANLANVVVLEIYGNFLTNVSGATFQGLVSVEHIGMGGSNPIETFPDDTFRDLPKLSHLGLLGLPLVSVSDRVWAPLQSLKSISMSDSRLRSIPVLPVSLESFSIYRNNQMLTELRLGDFTTLPRSETGQHLPLPHLTSLTLRQTGLQKIHPFAFSTLPALKTLDLSSNNFQSILSVDPDAFGNLTTLLSLNVDKVTTWSPRVFRHLPCLQAVTLGKSFICTSCDLLDLGKWINKTAVNVQPSSPTCSSPVSLQGRSLKSLREEDFGTCPATTAPPATEPAVQICPTPSPSMATPSQGSPYVTTPKSSKPPSPSPTIEQTGICISPRNVTVHDVKDSRAEVEWIHGGSTDLTGFVIKYKPHGEKEWMKTKPVHTTVRRSDPILDLLPDTPYTACVTVFCNNIELKQKLAIDDQCVEFTTEAVAGLSQATVVGLGVGLPLLLIILVMAALIFLWKRKGLSSAEHVDARTPNHPQQQEAPADSAEADSGVTCTDDSPYNIINDNRRSDRRPSQENPYQDPESLQEPTAGRITSSYLELSQCGAKNSMINSRANDEESRNVPIPTPRPSPSTDRKGSSSSFNNSLYDMPGPMADNTYSKVNDVGSGEEQNASPDEGHVYINIIG